MIASNSASIWRVRDKVIDLSRRTFLMGVLNVTPDSFSDGGRFLNPDKAFEHACMMIDDGADIIDVGGESTRPGSVGISVQEELDRVLPVVERLASSDSFISIDTTKSEVADAALKAGAHIVNDISALNRDPEMKDVVKKYSAGIVIMHMRGIPADMQTNTGYDDFLNDIASEMEQALEGAYSAGILPETVAVDPGIGFSKTAQQNLAIIKNLKFFKKFNRPLLIGVSRKSFINSIIESSPGDRLFPTCAAVAVSVFCGANIVRVHDMRELRQVVKMTDGILNSGDL